MSDKYLTLPSTGQLITSGSVVTVNTVPDTTWVVQYDWHTSNNQLSMGWYIVSIIDNTMLDIDDNVLNNLVIVDTNFNDAPTPPIVPSVPFIPTDSHTHHHVHHSYDEEARRSLITVNTIEQRDDLSYNLPLIDGKIVRVNSDGEGNLAYFEWNATTHTWDTWSLGPNYLTAEQIANMYATAEQVAELQSAVTWGRIKQEGDNV